MKVDYKLDVEIGVFFFISLDFVVRDRDKDKTRYGQYFTGGATSSPSQAAGTRFLDKGAKDLKGAVARETAV